MCVYDGTCVCEKWAECLLLKGECLVPHRLQGGVLDIRLMAVFSSRSRVEEHAVRIRSAIGVLGCNFYRTDHCREGARNT